MQSPSSFKSWYLTHGIAQLARVSSFFKKTYISRFRTAGMRNLITYTLYITNILYDTHKAHSGRIVLALLGMCRQRHCFRSCDKMLDSNYSVCYPATGSTTARERVWEEHHFCPTPNVTWRHAGYSSDRLNIKICVLPRLRLSLTKCFNNARLHFRLSSVRTGKSEGPG